jgi:hypothetical protein
MNDLGIIDRAVRSLRYRGARAKRMIGLSAQRSIKALYRQIPGALDDQLLYAVYDLNVMPASFDILWFLAAAEAERRRRGLSGIHVILSLFDRPYVHPAPIGHPDHVSEADMLWRVNVMLAPCCSLVPSCSSYSISQHAIATARMLLSARHVWPERWGSNSAGATLTDVYNSAISDLTALEISGPLRAPQQALRFIEDWKEKFIGQRDLVTVTLREYCGTPARNSLIREWIAFAHNLPQRFKIVFVPDTFNALTTDEKRYGGHDTCITAAHSLPLRLALYESAYLNLYVSNGPAYLAVLDKNCRYLMFKILVQGVHAASKEHLENQGFAYGTTPAFATAFQSWVWKDDTLPAIQQAFDDMREKIDRSPNAKERMS